MAVKKRVSQDAFDAAVKENMEAFDMEPEEALEAAITDFKLQGVDLSGIIKRASTADELSTDVKESIAQLEGALAASTAVASACKMLAALVNDKYKERSKEVLAALGTKGGVMLLSRAVEQALIGKDAETLLVALDSLTVVLEYWDNKKLFGRIKGCALLHNVWEQHADAPTRAAVCAAAAAASRAYEDGKGELMDNGLAESIVQALTDGTPPAVSHYCAVITSLTTADDLTAPSSRAFPNSRRLAAWGAATQLTALLKHEAAHGDAQSATLLPLCTALRGVAANDDICREAAEAGALAAIAMLLKQDLAIPAVVAATSLLKQLANSDANKADIMAAGGGELLLTVLSKYQDSTEVVEQVLGTLSVLTLRNPETAEKLLEVGAMDVVLELLQDCHTRAQQMQSKKDKVPLSAVLRQGCMIWRNSACRSPSVRQALLDRGAERLLRSVLGSPYAGTVLEAASACLRDLGLDDYHVPVKAA